jgi:hypothetical protein
MKRCLLILMGCLVSSGAWGQTSTSVPQEVRAFKQTYVLVSDGAKKCNISDAGLLQKRVEDGLAKLGLNQSGGSIVYPWLAVDGDTFGVLDKLCLYSVNLSFRTVLTNEMIATNDATLRAALERMKSFPVTLYEDSIIGVETLTDPGKVTEAGGSKVARDKALAAVDQLVERFGKARSK